MSESKETVVIRIDVGDEETLIKIPGKKEDLFEVLFKAFMDVSNPETPEPGEKARFSITVKDAIGDEKKVYVILLGGRE